MDIYVGAQSRQDIKALFAIGAVDIMLIVAGGALLYNPDFLED